MSLAVASQLIILLLPDADMHGTWCTAGLWTIDCFSAGKDAFIGQESISQYVSNSHSTLAVNLSIWDQADNKISSGIHDTREKHKWCLIGLCCMTAAYNSTMSGLWHKQHHAWTALPGPVCCMHYGWLSKNIWVKLL